MIAPGTRFGNLVVIEELGSVDVGRERGCGAWCRVRCDCGFRKLVRSRHLRYGVKTCGRYPSCHYAVVSHTAAVEAAHEGRRRRWAAWRALKSSSEKQPTRAA